MYAVAPFFGSFINSEQEQDKHHRERNTRCSYKKSCLLFPDHSPSNRYHSLHPVLMPPVV